MVVIMILVKLARLTMRRCRRKRKRKSWLIMVSRVSTLYLGPPSRAHP